MSCRCMKTTTQSGQAWRGYERAQRGKMAKIRRSLWPAGSLILRRGKMSGQKETPRRMLLGRCENWSVIDVVSMSASFALKS